MSSTITDKEVQALLNSQNPTSKTLSEDVGHRGAGKLIAKKRPSGSVEFRFKYYPDRKRPTEIVIGRYQLQRSKTKVGFTIAQARKKALEYSQRWQQGIDPKKFIEAEKERRREGETGKGKTERGITTTMNRVRSFLHTAFKVAGQAYLNPVVQAEQKIDFGLRHNPVSVVPRQSSYERALDRNLSEKLLILPKEFTKNRREHTVPLNNLALEILHEQREHSGHCLYPFPCRIGNGFVPDKHIRLDCPSRSTRRLIAGTGMEHFTPRDIRRTCKTLMGKAGISKDIRDRIHNHALNDVSSRHYDRYDDRYEYILEKREALDHWNIAMKAIIESGSNVIVLPRKAS